jgi:serine/threonine-protein kinase
MPSSLALFGRLVADRVLAESSTSVLYEARAEAHHPSVIIKTARAGADWSAVMSVKREIVVLERLRHPGIVSLFDHGEANGVPWYAMERIEGGYQGRNVSSDS